MYMKATLITLLIISSACFSQTRSEKKIIQKILGSWKFERFEEANKIGDSLVIKKSGTIEPTTFVFSDDNILTVNFNDIVTENFKWKIEKNYIKITSNQKSKFSSKLNEIFKLFYWNDDKELFMQIKNKPHNGIKLKR